MNDDWSAVIPTRNDRPGLLRDLITVLSPGRVVIVHTVGEDISPDVEGCRNVRYEGPLNIQSWWNHGIEAAGTRYVALINDDVVMTNNVVPHLVAACVATSSPVARVWQQGVHFGRSGFLFVLDTDSPVKPDERFRWWYGDDDIFRQADMHGGNVDVRVHGVEHRAFGLNNATATTDAFFAPIVAVDRERFYEKWQN